MRKTLIGICLLVTVLAFGQFSDQQLYQAYMQSDLKLWGQYIDSQNWDQLSHQERKRLINYEYGYIPFLADLNRMNEAAKYLAIYNQHLASEQKHLNQATYTAYLSAAHAYAYLIDKSLIFSDGMQSFKLAKLAVEQDPHDVIALSLKGNVNFYAPRLFGGDKLKAMAMFLEAEKTMEQNPYWEYLWNYPAMQLCIAQCYEKLGDLDNALLYANKTLARHPNFKFLKETYLPELQKKMKKK